MHFCYAYTKQRIKNYNNDRNAINTINTQHHGMGCVCVCAFGSCQSFLSLDSGRHINRLCFYQRDRHASHRIAQLTHSLVLTSHTNCVYMHTNIFPVQKLLKIYFRYMLLLYIECESTCGECFLWFPQHCIYTYIPTSCDLKCYCLCCLFEML